VHGRNDGVKGSWPPPGQPQQPAYQQPGQPPPAFGAGPSYEPLPGLAPTIVITVLFGLFGLIPAAIAAGKARRAGVSENRYWIAFGASMAGSVVLYAVVALAFLGLVVGVASESGTASARTSAEATAESEPALQPPAEPTDVVADGRCVFSPDTSGNPNLVDVGTPPSQVPTNGTATVALENNFGPLGLTLDRSLAPCASASFVHLAEQGFFDDSICHRLVDQPGFGVLQCGDPTGTGSGGPSYKYAEEVTPTTTYPRGTIAMAKTSAPSSTGSQFFLCFVDTELPPEYTVVGTVDDAGLQALDAIAANGSDGSMEPSPGGGAPLEPVEIEAATVAG
jgi:cyclophilin family peptidyl-prolyl cis-trans isomerase